MKKSLFVMLSVLVALTMGAAFIHCGNGDGDTCEGGAECCAAVPCTAPQVCNNGTCCTPACDGKDCGDDSCGGTCGTCDTGETCNASGQCEPCTPDCTGKVCGDDGCGGETCGTCDTGFECNDDGSACVECCCDCTPLNASVAGTVIQFPPSPVTPLQVTLAAVDAMSALTNPTPPHLSEATSDAMGAYETPCMDLTNVSLAVMMLVDDAGFDGTAGTFFPTYSGVISIDDNDDKTCSDADTTPPVFGMPNALVAGLAAQSAPLADIATDGFAVVLVTDDQQNPVDGAVLKKEDDTDLAVVVYPNATFDAFDGTETSANGVALVPGPLSLTNVKAVKTGSTWAPGPLAIVPGYCLTRPLLADAP